MFGMDNGYWCYMNEVEATGLIDTREGRLNQIGRALRDMGYAGKVVPAPVFLALLDKYKVNDITQKEINQIEERWL